MGIITESGIDAQSFHDLCKADVAVKQDLELTDDTLISHCLRRFPQKHNEIVQRELKKMLDAGIVTQSISGWSFHVVIVSKKDGTPGFCVEYRALNSAMKPDK